MNIQFLGQNTFIFGLENHTVITDPAISANPIAKEINVEKIDADYILLTHAHGDHCSDVIEVAKKSDATLISNYEICLYYGAKGIKYHPMNHGGKWKFDFGTIAMVNAVHTSTFPDGASGGNPCGFVLMAEGKCIYIAGDTALTMDMKIIPEIYPSLDVALLPIGDNFTMGIDEAVIASQYISCKNIIGCHYDTFPYIEINHESAKEKFNSAGINLHLLEIGESKSI